MTVSNSADAAVLPDETDFSPEGDRFAHWYLVAQLLVASNALVSLVQLPSFLSDLVMPAAALVVLLRAPKETVRRMPVSLLALALLAWMCMSLLWSVDPTFTSYLLRVEILGCVSILLVVAVIPARETLRALISVTRLLVVLTAAILVVDPSTRSELQIPTQTVLEGWRAGFIQKNAMGMAIVMSLAVVLIFDRRGPLRTSTLLAGTVLVLGSRSSTSYAGLIVVFGTYVWCRRLYRRSVPGARITYVLGSLLLGATAVVAGVLYAPTVLGIFGKDVTLSNRTDIWSASLDALAARPWIGYGLGGLFFHPNQEPTYSLDRAIGFQAAHAHNGPLDLALQIGVVGVALYLVLFVSIVRRGMALFNRRPDVATWILITCALTLTLSITENSFFGAPFVYLLVLHAFVLRVQVTDGVELDPMVDW